jgi:hypothetical protein
MHGVMDRCTHADATEPWWMGDRLLYTASRRIVIYFAQELDLNANRLDSRVAASSSCYTSLTGQLPNKKTRTIGLASLVEMHARMCMCTAPQWHLPGVGSLD